MNIKSLTRFSGYWLTNMMKKIYKKS